MKIGERIRQRREELGLSVDDLAKLLGKHRATIYRYENGNIGELPSSVLEPVAHVLNTTPAWLMGWDDPDTEKQPSAGGELSEAQKELIDFVSGLPDETCRAILLVLRGQSPPDAPGGQ